jgi:sugar lactone lactonase YvrE
MCSIPRDAVKSSVSVEPTVARPPIEKQLTRLGGPPMVTAPTIEARPLLQPSDNQLRFLPEGPYPCGDGRISWVAIQHAADVENGSLNFLDLANAENDSLPLQGRPGFAFPTNRQGVFAIGLERRLQLFDTHRRSYEPLCDEEIDGNTTGTIINDGVAFAEGLVFGAKDLEFAEKKAGLYLWRRRDRQLIQLRDDQICSNGKVIQRLGDHWRLIDIDSPTQLVVSYELHVDAGTLSDPRVVVDLTSEEFFPDGMVASPDGESVIIAMYNPNDAPHGEARQYSLRTGAVEAVWITPQSPQVTCPQLVELDGRVVLVLTTAVEHMTADRRERHAEAGSMFVAETPFTSTPDTPRVELDS